MSGRSGYGRSKIVGKLINLPANMMMAGLAPKVGKPGWAIRLYWRRIEECFCECPPIRIIRRFFSPGNVTDAQLGGFGITTRSNLLPNQPTGNQMYYGIVFNRAIKSPQAIIPTPSTAEIILQTPTGVDWSTGAPGGGITLDINLTNNDFQILDNNSGLLGGLNTGLIIDIGDGVVGTGIGVAQWDQVNTPSAPSAAMQTVHLQSTALTGDMAYIITNPTLVGGYAMLFNVTRLFLSSSSGPILSSSPAPTNSFLNTQLLAYGGGGGSTGLDLFRQNLAIAAGFATTTVANPTNNISTTFNPPTSTVTFTAEDCPPENGGSTTFNAPVGGFSIAAGNGQPALVLLP